MLETWRWFGPDDPVSLDNVREAGAAGVVSALHHMNRGEVWTADEVLKRRAEIERAGLVWPVVESIGVGEEIKTRSGGFRAKIDNYKQSIRNAARAGVKTFCYNFMGLTDWTRTHLNWPLVTGGTALRFDATDFAAYDLFILEREGAEADYPPERIAAARARFEAMRPREMEALERTLIDWLPARDFTYDRRSFKRALALYKDVTVEDLRANLIAFVREIVATAEEEDARLASIPTTPPSRSSACRGSCRPPRTCASCFKPCPRAPMASRSARAPSAPTLKTISSRWRRSSVRGSISPTCGM
jgi:mannonate dehydratase